MKNTTNMILIILIIALIFSFIYLYLLVFYSESQLVVEVPNRKEKRKIEGIARELFTNFFDPNYFDIKEDLDIYQEKYNNIHINSWNKLRKMVKKNTLKKIISCCICEISQKNTAEEVHSNVNVKIISLQTTPEGKEVEVLDTFSFKKIVELSKAVMSENNWILYDINKEKLYE